MSDENPLLDYGLGLAEELAKAYGAYKAADLKSEGEKSAYEGAQLGSQRAIDNLNLQTDRARGDLNRLYPNATANMLAGYQGGLGAINQTLPLSLGAIQGGNQAAQNQLKAGQQQHMNAILGMPVDMSQVQTYNPGITVPKFEMPEFNLNQSPVSQAPINPLGTTPATNPLDFIPPEVVDVLNSLKQSEGSDNEGLGDTDAGGGYSNLDGFADPSLDADLGLDSGASYSDKFGNTYDSTGAKVAGRVGGLLGGPLAGELARGAYSVVGAFFTQDDYDDAYAKYDFDTDWEDELNAMFAYDWEDELSKPMDTDFEDALELNFSIDSDADANTDTDSEFDLGLSDVNLDASPSPEFNLGLSDVDLGISPSTEFNLGLAPGLSLGDEDNVVDSRGNFVGNYDAVVGKSLAEIEAEGSAGGDGGTDRGGRGSFENEGFGDDRDATDL